MKKIVIFGAGKIGRSFIGQLFSLSGYKVVFVDVFEPVINELNRRKEYNVIIKSDNPDKIIRVENVSGVLASNEVRVAEELMDCDIAAISVGQKGLPKVISLIVNGLVLRQKKYGHKPLDFILAENMRNADIFVKDLLQSQLSTHYPLDELVGLIETSIGKMVPIMTKEEQEKDLLTVYAEPYNTLILDKNAFKNPIPEANGLAPKENIKAWVDRKSYIHNFGHAAAAYAGFQFDPTIRYLADALKIPSVEKFTREAMLESARVLIHKYPDEFSIIDLTNHIDDLLFRFKNRALGDTVFRVGCDLSRKLSKNDRILSPLLDGIQFNLPVDNMIETFVDGLYFRASDENGNMFPNDIEFCYALEKKGLYHVLHNICELSYLTDIEVIELIKSSYLKIVLNGFSFNQSA
jgi:mannitol-1-phosphate 5-dehydrogenase